MIKCAIFDFDGTIFDTMEVWDSVAKIFLTSLNRKPKSDLTDVIKTMSLYQSAEYLKKEYSLSLSIEEIMESINKIIEDFYFYEALPKKGVVKFLQELKRQGIHICIATATDRYLIEAALKRCEMEKYFEKIFTCTEVGHGKDEPIIYEVAAEYFGAEKSESIVFEDAFHAIETAKKAGFIVAGVFDKSETNQSQIRTMADYYIEDFQNRSEILK